MNNSLHVYFILFILIKILIFFCKTDARFKNCGNEFVCGSIIHMKYPFWGVNRPNYCGKLGYKIDCDNGTIPVIEVKSLNYRVLDVNYQLQTLMVARMDYWGEICPARLINTTIDFTCFNYTTDTRILTLGYDCPLSKSQSTFQEYSCTINGTKTNVTYAPSIPCNQSVFGLFLEMLQVISTITGQPLSMP